MTKMVIEMAGADMVMTTHLSGGDVKERDEQKTEDAKHSWNCDTPINTARKSEIRECSYLSVIDTDELQFPVGD